MSLKISADTEDALLQVFAPGAANGLRYPENHLVRLGDLVTETGSGERWKKLRLEQSLGTRLITYADDLVILCRRGSAEKALHHLREIMGVDRHGIRTPFWG